MRRLTDEKLYSELRDFLRENYVPPFERNEGMSPAATIPDGKAPKMTLFAKSVYKGRDAREECCEYPGWTDYGGAAVDSELERYIESVRDESFSRMLLRCIDEEHAANYCHDSAGTQLNYEAMNEAVRAVRCCAPVEGWKSRIEADFQKRGRKQDNSIILRNGDK